MDEFTKFFFRTNGVDWYESKPYWNEAFEFIVIVLESCADKNYPEFGIVQECKFQGLSPVSWVT